MKVNLKLVDGRIVLDRGLDLRDRRLKAVMPLIVLVNVDDEIRGGTVPRRRSLIDGKQFGWLVDPNLLRR